MHEGEKFEDVPTQDKSAAWGVKYDRIVSQDLADQDNEHLSYIGFVRIFEEAQRAFQEEREMDHSHLLERHGLRLFVKKLTVEYESEAKIGDELKVFTKVLMPGKTSVRYHQAILNEQNQLTATSEFVIVAVDEQGKPKELPPEVRGGLTTLNIEEGTSQ